STQHPCPAPGPVSSRSGREADLALHLFTDVVRSGVQQGVCQFEQRAGSSNLVADLRDRRVVWVASRGAVTVHGCAVRCGETDVARRLGTLFDNVQVECDRPCLVHGVLLTGAADASVPSMRRRSGEGKPTSPT